MNGWMNQQLCKSKQLYIFNPLVFTDLLRQMWEAKKGTGQVIVPTHLKQRISQLSPTFYGHQ